MVASRLVIYPYKMGSRSAKDLAARVTTIIGNKVRRVREVGRYHPKMRSVVLNWGNARRPQWAGGWGWEDHDGWLNTPGSVAVASNKHSAFALMKTHEIPTPDWTAEWRVAESWLREGSIVLSRMLLNSHSGRGIHINHPEEPYNLVRAPLYVKYKKKRKEFRVHVFNGQVIDLAEKRKFRTERRDESFVGLIRNHSNGWAFCRSNIIEPAGLRNLAIQSVASLGLNFGACDIIWNEKENKCYTLEVNTAPGLEGTTLERYSQAVARLVKANGI